MGHDPLKNILYISVPEGMNRKIGDFTLDAGILLPVEVEDQAPEHWDFTDIKAEMILSAILKILAYNPGCEDITYYRSFVKAIRPDIVETLTDVSKVKLEAKDFDLAEEVLLSLIGLEPDDPVHELNLALVYESRIKRFLLSGEPDRVKEYEINTELIYNKILERKKVPILACYWGGLFFMRIGYFEKAKEILARFVDNFKVKDDDPEGLENIKNAKTMLIRCDELSGNDVAYRDAYQAILDDRNSEGIEKIEQYLEEQNDSANAWFLMGWALRKKGEFARAKNAFLKAHKLSPDKETATDILNELAICEMELANYTESEKFLNEALLLDYENVKIISNMGILKLKMGDKEEAIRFFETALVIDPKDAVAMRYLDFLKNS